MTGVQTCALPIYLSHKQILSAGVLVAFVMAILMSICYMISMQASASSMPIFEVARSHGLGVLAAIVVYLAIFTTLIGSGRAFADMILKFVPHKWFVFILFFTLGCYFDGLDFAALVAFCYDEIGEMGLVVCFAVFCNLIYGIIYKIKSDYKNKYNNLKSLV